LTPSKKKKREEQSLEEQSLEEVATEERETKKLKTPKKSTRRRSLDDQIKKKTERRNSPRISARRSTYKEKELETLTNNHGKVSPGKNIEEQMEIRVEEEEPIEEEIVLPTPLVIEKEEILPTEMKKIKIAAKIQKKLEKNKNSQNSNTKRLYPCYNATCKNDALRACTNHCCGLCCGFGQDHHTCNPHDLKRNKKNVVKGTVLATTVSVESGSCG